MRIIITGTPGVGKSSLAKWLAQTFGFSHISVNTFVKSQGLHQGFDSKHHSYVIDIRLLRDRLRSVLSNDTNVIVDTVYVTGVLPKKGNTVCLVLRLDPVLLYNRLRKRRWNKKKCWTNVEAELIDSVLIDAIAGLGKRRVFQIDTTHKSQDQVQRMAMKIIRGQMKRHIQINWLRKYDPIELQRRLL